MNDVFLSFDFGKKIIGVAVGQRITGTAYPLSVLKIKNNNLDWKMIKNLINEWKPKAIVVGLPLNMDGTNQFLTFCARDFADKIHRLSGIIVVLHDERLSTLEARSRLFEFGGFRALKKEKVNSISAVVILESYFRQITNHF